MWGRGLSLLSGPLGGAPPVYIHPTWARLLNFSAFVNIFNQHTRFQSESLAYRGGLEMSRNRLHYGVFSIVLLMSVFLVVFLASCGSETPSKPEPAPEKVESTQAQAPAESPPAEQVAMGEKTPTEPAPEKAESTQAQAPAGSTSTEPAAQEEKAPTEPAPETTEATPPSTEQAGGAEMQGGGPIVFSDTKAMPPVTFQHELHASKGLNCTDCHTGVFPMQKGGTPKADITMAAMREGKACGICHNGDKAFTVAGNCTKCHAR